MQTARERKKRQHRIPGPGGGGRIAKKTWNWEEAYSTELGIIPVTRIGTATTNDEFWFKKVCHFGKVFKINPTFL